MYADGTSYSYAQFCSRLRLQQSQAGTARSDYSISHNNSQSHTYTGVTGNGSGMGWMEMNIEAVRNSFESEMRQLDSEIIELRGKLRQSECFSAELSRRFEDSLKTQYGNNGNNATSTGLSGLARSQTEQKEKEQQQQHAFVASSLSQVTDALGIAERGLHEEKDRAR